MKNKETEKRGGGANKSALVLVVALMGLAAWLGALRGPDAGQRRLEDLREKQQQARQNARTSYLWGYPFDLNQASVKDLALLPGIGEKTAARIIDSRNRKGGFRNMDDLKDTPGLAKPARQALVRWTTIGEKGASHGQQ